MVPPRLALRERGLGGEGMPIDTKSQPIIVKSLPLKERERGNSKLQFASFEPTKALPANIATLIKLNPLGF